MKLAIIGGLFLLSSSAYAQCTCGDIPVYRSWVPQVSYEVVEPAPYEWTYRWVEHDFDSDYILPNYSSYRYPYRYGYRSVLLDQAKKPVKSAAKASVPEGLKLLKDQVDKCNLRQYFAEEKAHGKDQAQKTMRDYCK